MMDSMHDLGGKQGFGPVPVKAGDAPFSHDWERRMWALARSGIAHGITIDWFRHGLERMVPADYLTFPYFKKWVTNYLMLIIDNGAVTMDEVLKGHIATPAAPADPLTLAEVLDRNRASAASFATETDAAPAFAVGDAILTNRHGTTGHSRLPAYARGARGTIITQHGAHALPDKGALGIHAGEHLYTVSFGAPELWGADADPRDTVTLELWESYLVRP
jgi:nitrile hydratase